MLVAPFRWVAIPALCAAVYAGVRHPPDLPPLPMRPLPAPAAHAHHHREPEPLRLDVRAEAVSVKLAAIMLYGLTGKRIEVDPDVVGVMRLALGERRGQQQLHEAFLDAVRAAGYRVTVDGERTRIHGPDPIR